MATWIVLMEVTSYLDAMAVSGFMHNVFVNIYVAPINLVLKTVSASCELTAYGIVKIRNFGNIFGPEPSGCLLWDFAPFCRFHAYPYANYMLLIWMLSLNRHQN